MSGITQEQIEEAARAIVITTAELSPVMREDGVKDLKPISLKTCGLFAKALIVERRFGHTTPEATYFLDQALAALPV